MSSIQDCDNEVTIDGDVIVQIPGEVEVKNDVGSPVPVSIEDTVNVNVTNHVIVEPGDDPLAVTFTPAAPVERTQDGDIQVGAGTIVIPDGVRSYAVTVLEGGDNVSDLSTWVTIETPDFAAPVPLKNGQSVSAAADESNVLAGPITITVPANAAANATWVEA